MHLIRGAALVGPRSMRGVGVVLITCSARPMKIGGDPKEEWLLPEVKSSHTFLCMILLLPKLLRYRSFIVNLFGSSDQLVVFYYFSSRKSFLLSPFLSILKFYLFFLPKSGFRCYQSILSYFLLSVGSLEEELTELLM